jgi:UDP-N-acetylmuramoyl-L-alanyl-D-glutamate--2,6-diaminopimelate ligase
MISARKIVKYLIPERLFRKIEPTGHLIEAVLANIRYGFPSRGMRVIGVTGTNGKTTTTFLIHHMLHDAGYKVGMLSTVAYGVGKDVLPQIEHMTTSKPSVLQKRLRDFKRQGVEWVVLETSSHALAQNRVWGINYEIAVMTNVTSDHLDYHGTFGEYLTAKRRLFKIASRHGLRYGVINSDDPNCDQFASDILKSVSYGIESGDLKAHKIKLEADCSTFEATMGEDSYQIRVNIPGDFNIYNSLAAIAVGRIIGLPKDKIEKGIMSLEGVEGRMMTVNEGQKFRVIIDFASTPDAFERFFKAIRPVTEGKLIAVFGSAGRRDESKRAVQGEIAAKYCDEIVITEEDDRDVDGEAIMRQIAEGASKNGKVEKQNMFLVHDRSAAIDFAMCRASAAKDTVVLLGKGHEKTIERDDGAHAWSELDVTRRVLKRMLSANR